MKRRYCEKYRYKEENKFEWKLSCA